MKIIKDNFNKEIICSHCGSVFTYNEKEIENECYHFSSACGGNWSEMRKLVKCPLCDEYTFLKKES